MIQPNSRAWWLLLLLCVSAMLWVLHAELWLNADVPASYDLTGHVLPIAELRYRLLPQGRLHGWSASWFAGFPLYYFYFPLPALLAAALSLVVSLEAALKLTSVVGLLALPFAIYTLFRALQLARAHAALAAAVSSTFLLMQSFWFLGGNIASTVAGEFSYSISFALSLFYLATLLRPSTRPMAFIVPALLLAAVALSHLVPTIVVVAVSAILMNDAAKRHTIVLSWIAAFLLSAFWTVPFVLRHGEMAAVYADAARSFAEFLPFEFWFIIPGALAGALFARQQRAARPLILIAGAGVALYLIGGRLVYPGRFLPYWFLGAHMLAGFSVVAAWRGMRRGRAAAIIAVALLPMLVVNAMRGPGYLRDWSHAAYGGLQARASWPELQTLFAQMSQGNGRVYWEQAPQPLSALGSRNLAAVTPYLANGRPVINGLWLESSRAHSQLVEIDSAIARARYDKRHLDIALREMNELGVTRFVALTPETTQLLAQSGVAVEASSRNYAIFRLPGKPLVTASGAQVEITEWSDERVRFRTTSPGTPHVVRMSYFPNWRARGGALVRGDDNMMAVTPTAREVELHFVPTAVETAGTIISIAAALGLAAATAWLRRRARTGGD